jgi:hypothetical protein
MDTPAPRVGCARLVGFCARETRPRRVARREHGKSLQRRRGHESTVSVPGTDQSCVPVLSASTRSSRAAPAVPVDHHAGGVVLLCHFRLLNFRRHSGGTPLGLPPAGSPDGCAVARADADYAKQRRPRSNFDATSRLTLPSLSLRKGNSAPQRLSMTRAKGQNVRRFRVAAWHRKRHVDAHLVSSFHEGNRRPCADEAAQTRTLARQPRQDFCAAQSGLRGLRGLRAIHAPLLLTLLARHNLLGASRRVDGGPSSRYRRHSPVYHQWRRSCAGCRLFRPRLARATSTFALRRRRLPVDTWTTCDGRGGRRRPDPTETSLTTPPPRTAARERAEPPPASHARDSGMPAMTPSAIAGTRSLSGVAGRGSLCRAEAPPTRRTASGGDGRPSVKPDPAEAR